MRILAIRFARLGDVVLLLPALAALKESFPEAHLTFLTGHRCAPIAELCPAIDEVISVDRIAMRDGPALQAFRDMAKLVQDVRKRDFDLVVDFHSFRETNLLTWLSGAPSRVGMKRYKAPYWGFCFNRPPVLEDKSLHVSEMFQRVVETVTGKASSRQAQVLTVTNEVLSNSPRLALYVDAPVPERIWPAKSFAEVADFAVEKLGAEVLVISGKEGWKLTEDVQAASRNRESLRLFSGVTIPRLVQLIASARLLVSNDTGPMHIGPAVGVRTLGLFSVGYPEHFQPIGPGDRYLRANPIEKLSTNEVIETVAGMWIIADRDLQH